MVHIWRFLNRKAEGLIHSIITSGANIVHDIIEAIGHHHLQGSYGADDEHLIHDNIGRIGNIFMNMDSFTALEDTLYQIFPKLFSTKKRLSSSELLLGIGQQLSDPHSILVQAAKHHVPIYSPGILDSMLGLHLWIWKQTHAIQLDLLEDMDQLSNQINTAKKTAAIILGGGIPKHFTMGANTLREGLDAAVQIISGSAHDGSLSGAPLSEGLGWHMVKPNRQYVTIRADATMAFPILIMGIKQFLASKR